MSFDSEEVEFVISTLRTELDTLLHVEKNRTPIGGFVVATEGLDAIKELPGNKLMLHPADLKGMIIFKTRENAEDIARFWNDKLAERGSDHQRMRVKVMTKKEHLLALIPHHRKMIEAFERVRDGLSPFALEEYGAAALCIILGRADAQLKRADSIVVPSTKRPGTSAEACMLLTHQSLLSRGRTISAFGRRVRKAFVFGRVPEIIYTSTFRWFSILSGGCAICMLLTSSFMYWRTSSYVIAGIDRSVSDLADTLSVLSPSTRLELLRRYLTEDPGRTKLIGLFDANGIRIFGNIETPPQSLRPDALTQDLALVRTDSLEHDQQVVRAGVRRLADGMMLVIGRNVDEVKQIGGSVRRALALGLVSVLGIGLAGAAFVGVKLRRRIELVNQLAERIEAGELNGRMPVTGTNDPFDELATLFNRMFDRIEGLIGGVAAVGDGIAHDLRTPLSHVRLILERGLENATGLDQLRAVIDRAIAGLDRSLTIVTAILRIAQIEHSRRRAGFGNVRLRELVHAIGELYEPIAENKRVSLTLKADQEVTVWGDRDLLLDAIANLVDNALKFTPQGGQVQLELCCTRQEVTLRVTDSGPGIPAEERDYVTRRFYRSQESRGKPGLGLGLSLVAAVTQLHGFQFSISAGPGCLAQIAIPRNSSGAESKT